MKMRKVMKKKEKQWQWQKIMKRPSMCRCVNNVLARARKAASKAKAYHTSVAGLGDVAAAAYAAKTLSQKAMKRADSAHEEAGDAKKDALVARVMVFQHSKRIVKLEDAAAETAARAERDEEQKRTDFLEDRQSGDVTP